MDSTQINGLIMSVLSGFLIILSNILRSQQKQKFIANLEHNLNKKCSCGGVPTMYEYETHGEEEVEDNGGKSIKEFGEKGAEIRCGSCNALIYNIVSARGEKTNEVILQPTRNNFVKLFRDDKGWLMGCANIFLWVMLFCGFLFIVVN